MISNQTHTSNTTELAETKQHKFHVKDPGSALTHFIAMIGAAIAAVPLLHKAAEEADSRHLAALAVFIISMILLYAASTTYHTFNISEHVNKILRKIDHMMCKSAPSDHHPAADPLKYLSGQTEGTEFIAGGGCVFPKFPCHRYFINMNFIL